MSHHKSAGEPRNPPPPSRAPKIIVVGPCAAGKSTLVETLQARGYNAHVAAQEHSAIASLWQHAQPDILIALEADIAAVRARRGEEWPEWLHDVQVQRLRAASAAADLTIDTTDLNPETVSSRVLAFLAARTQPDP